MTREERLAELARQADEQAAFNARKRKFYDLQDSYYLHYEIGETRLTIRFAAFKLMTIPYSQILDIEVASIFGNRSAQINLSNGRGQSCRIKKSRGWFRYVIISPREPWILLDAFYKFRSLTDPVSDMTDMNAPLPPFLQPHDDRQ